MPVAYMDQDFETAAKISAVHTTVFRDAIARAIAEERERCAEIAESMDGEFIAGAIRMGAVMTATRPKRVGAVGGDTKK